MKKQVLTEANYLIFQQKCLSWETKSLLLEKPGFSKTTLKRVMLIKLKKIHIICTAKDG